MKHVIRRNLSIIMALILIFKAIPAGAWETITAQAAVIDSGSVTVETESGDEPITLESQMEEGKMKEEVSDATASEAESDTTEEDSARDMGETAEMDSSDIVRVTVETESGEKPIIPGYWMEGVDITVKFSTATASEAWYEAVGEADPGDYIEVTVDEDYEDYLKPVMDEDTYLISCEEESVYIFMGIYVGPDAPKGTASVQVTIGDWSEPVTFKLIIGEAPDSIKIVVPSEIQASRGKNKRIAFQIRMDSSVDPTSIGAWAESSDEDTVECWVERNGNSRRLWLKPKKEGTAEITIHVRDQEAVCQVTVGKRPVGLTRTSITVNTADQDTAYLGINYLPLDDMDGEYEDGENWNKQFLTEHQAVWTSSNPEVAEVQEITEEDETNVEGINVVGKKAGTATITMTLADQCDPVSCQVTVVEGELPADMVTKLNKVVDDMWEVMNDDESTDEAKKDAIEAALEKAAEICKGQELLEDAWTFLEELQWAIIDNGYTSDDYMPIADDEAILDGITGWGLNLPLDSDNPQTLFVTMGTAPQEDADRISTDRKYAFTMEFATGSEGDADDSTKHTTLTTLRIPMRVIFNIPAELLEVEDLRLYNIHDSILNEVPTVRDGDRLLATITQCSTFIMTRKIAAQRTYSGGVPSSVNTVKTGAWVQDAIGWWYRKPDGTWPMNTWMYLTYNNLSDWYHFDIRGYMDTGWLTDQDGRIYYLNPVSDGRRGAMITGTRVIDGISYYFNEMSDGYKGALVK